MDSRFVSTAFATAFTIVDPVGMIPLTLAVTAFSDARERAAIVDRAIVVATLVVFAMALVGQPLLAYLGITLPAFTIAGGILLFLIAVDMLFARRVGAKQSDEEEREAAVGGNPAVFPLAIPMIAGPGTIATVIVLVTLTHGDRAELAVIFVAYAAALAAAWGCMRAATTILRIIGHTGIHVVTRIFGIMLAALAVQFVLNGVAETPFVRH